MTIELKRKGILFCLVGPTGGGKTTFSLRLREEFPTSTRLSISATSRAPRSGEEEGRSYFFMTREQFESKIKAGAFFEWEETHGNLYGTLRETVNDAISKGIDLVLDVDIRGAINFKKHFPAETVVVFLVPPSFKVLQERIDKRGKLGEKELAARFATASREYRQLLETVNEAYTVDYFIVNDVADESYSTVRGILLAERTRLGRLDVEQVRQICRID